MGKAKKKDLNCTEGFDKLTTTWISDKDYGLGKQKVEGLVAMKETHSFTWTTEH